MSNEGYWWCERCEAEKSPRQVTYQETCTLCGTPVVWMVLCVPCSRASGGERNIYHEEPACSQDSPAEPAEGAGE